MAVIFLSGMYAHTYRTRSYPVGTHLWQTEPVHVTEGYLKKVTTQTKCLVNESLQSIERIVALSIRRLSFQGREDLRKKLTHEPINKRPSFACELVSRDLNCIIAQARQLTVAVQNFSTLRFWLGGTTLTYRPATHAECPLAKCIKSSVLQPLGQLKLTDDERNHSKDPREAVLSGEIGYYSIFSS